MIGGSEYEDRVLALVMGSDYTRMRRISINPWRHRKTSLSGNPKEKTFLNIFVHFNQRTWSHWFWGYFPLK